MRSRKPHYPCLDQIDTTRGAALHSGTFRGSTYRGQPDRERKEDARVAAKRAVGQGRTLMLDIMTVCIMILNLHNARPDWMRCALAGSSGSEGKQLNPVPWFKRQSRVKRPGASMMLYESSYVVLRSRF